MFKEFLNENLQLFSRVRRVKSLGRQMPTRGLLSPLLVSFFKKSEIMFSESPDGEFVQAKWLCKFSCKSPLASQKQ